jgi:hypothetical protein
VCRRSRRLADVNQRRLSPRSRCRPFRAPRRKAGAVSHVPDTSIGQTLCPARSTFPWRCARSPRWWGTQWIGRFPDGDLTDEQRFEWVYGGRFLRNTHRVRNAAGDVVYEGETIFAWDPSNDRIAWWYWNTTGGHITGTMVETEQGWISEGENHAPSGQTPRVRGAMVDITSVSWESVQYFERDGEWIEHGSEAPGASDSPLPAPPSP